ncbi:Ribosomal protein L25/Gln-tRNA synthetase, anti-codon-binding domain [Pseudocohnilembus persalinus]|uniref:Ribosomal protein L25/Gln-tRNA synthetase, anti-codon-binding domain n=1 Tax=Pseudocohnilembus persalinus TaxID=266149 RepID=A0A0V0R005_PSEPJ|nr:Ribosomal protein L25/Gln-tRNA synthetase, anti-codon-binding domain [Pseudocohnilembus persalinus]|eukprot:KRX07887.1 Ribosomal protein L25/Gln-tRNA synthetase, anti-codon-binding domain [Pseudocohnilembus persalinus]
MNNLSVKNIQSLVFKVNRNFTIYNRGELTEQEHNLDSIQLLFAKKFRKQTLDSPILQRNKIYVPPKRFRQMDDHLLALKAKGECTGILEGREEFEDLDLVFDSKQIFGLRRKKDPYTQSYYMDINGEEIRFTLKEIYTHPFGRPNLLEMPLYFKPTLNNVRLNRGADFEFKMDSISVISYNSDYPTRIEIDPSNLTHTRGYKIGDLQNALPPGMFLHKKYSSTLNTNIVTIGGDREKMVQQELKRQQMMDQVTKGTDLEEEQRQYLKSDAPKKESNKKKKVRSLKKIVQSMQAEIKERLDKIK